MSGRTTKYRFLAKAAIVALMASIFVIPFGATGAGAATWHFSPGIEGAMVFGPDGAYYSFNDDYQVVRIDAAGHETVIAGRGFLDGNQGYPVTTKDHGWTEDTGYTGDGGPAVDAQLSFPVALAFDAQGNLYISDHGNDAIRKVDMQTGIITTVAGVGPSDVWVKGAWVPGVQSKGGDGGPATQGVLESPRGITFDAQGNLYIADRDHDAIRMVDTNGIITTVAGMGQRGYSGDGGPATKAKLYRPDGVVFDAAGNMYINDESNSRVRKVDANGIITTVGGTGALGCGGNGGPATAAQMQNPHGMGFGPDGSLYVSEGECFAVRKITPNGTILPVLGTGVEGCGGLNGGVAVSARIGQPGDLTFDARGAMYVDVGDCGGTFRVDPSGRVRLFLA